MPVHLEPVTTHNYAYMCALCKELHGLGTMSHIEFDDSYNRAVIHTHMTNPVWFMMLARDMDGVEYVGAMAGHVQASMFSQRMMAFEQGLYVRKGTRYRGSIALALVRAFMRWCYDTHDCAMIQAGDVASIESIAVDALYRHAGFRRYGAIYNHEPHYDAREGTV